MNKFYKKIIILEGFYLENKELFLKKDLSKYFKLDFHFDGKSIINDDTIKTNYSFSKDQFNSLKSFINYSLLKKDFKNIELDKIFYCKNKDNLILNNREYKIYKKHINKLNSIIKHHYKDFIKGVKNSNKFDLKFLDDKKFNIYRKFNFEHFFSDHESLFDKDNDFESINNKKLYHGLKDKKGKPINNLETEIKNISDENKFFIEIEFDKSLLNESKYEISGEKKYEYVFILERGSYLVYNKKNG